MAFWLFKEEPTHYSFGDLERDGKAVWDGVTNNLALQNLRKVKKGDRVFFYHSGKEKAVVGEMRVIAGARASAESEDGKLVFVEVKPVRRLATPVPLNAVKKDPALADWDLVRLSRLSVMPVSPGQWQRIHELAEES